MYIQVRKTTRIDELESCCTHLQVWKIATADQVVSSLTAPVYQLSSLSAKPVQVWRTTTMHQSACKFLERSCHEWKNKTTYQLVSFFPWLCSSLEHYNHQSDCKFVSRTYSNSNWTARSNQLLISWLNLFKIKRIQPQINLYVFDQIY